MCAFMLSRSMSGCYIHRLRSGMDVHPELYVEPKVS
jgi:hypothetical protein